MNTTFDAKLKEFTDSVYDINFFEELNNKIKEYFPNSTIKRHDVIDTYNYGYDMNIYPKDSNGVYFSIDNSNNNYTVSLEAPIKNKQYIIYKSDDLQSDNLQQLTSDLTNSVLDANEDEVIKFISESSDLHLLNSLTSDAINFNRDLVEEVVNNA